MRVQIFEQFHEGHYTNYIQHLLTTLVKLSNERLIDKITVSITPSHANSRAFQQQMASYSNVVKFDASLLEIGLDLTLSPKTILKNPRQALSAIERRQTILSNLTRSISQTQPDYLISTTSDALNLLLSIKEVCGIQTLSANLHSVGIVHYGYSGCAFNWNDILKDHVYRFTWKYAPWTRTLMVNPLNYEAIKAQDKLLAQKLSLVPDPVPSSRSLDKKLAREYLKVPVDGRYLGFIGLMDHRKAIPELVAAFKDAALTTNDRLLLAGKLLPEYWDFIHDNYQDLLDSGQIIVLDRYLNQDELIAGFCALDAAAILHRRLPTLSANLLRAIAFHKPVIADDFGYPGFILKQFEAGWLCDIFQHDSIVVALRRGLESCNNYQISEPVSRLIQFHSPENYANTVLEDLRNLIGSPIRPKTWEWVLGADHSSNP